MTIHQPARATAAAGALFTDDCGRILLVRPTYKDFWDIPGGYVEPGETPYEACTREVAEELGIRPPIGSLLVVDWAPAPNEGDKVLFVFDGGTLNNITQAAIQLQATELAEYRFITLTDAAALTVPRLVRRLTAALHSHREHRTVYLEHGTRVAARKGA